jgi:pimeloyl-ACP methyl ester carboxylesterase
LRTCVLDEGMGEPLVLLHGIPTQAFLWRDVARMVAREHRVIAPDLLGFGFADKPAGADLSPAGQARFISSLLDALGVASYALAGHDYGALVAAEMLATAPDRITRLTILNTSFWIEDWSGNGFNPLRILSMRGVGEMALRMAQPFMFRAALRSFTEDDARYNRDAMAVYWQPFEEGFDRTLLTLYRGPGADEQDFCRRRDALAAFQRPGLVVWGGRDPVFSAWRGRQIANLLPFARFECFEHANHFVPEDRPEALGRLLNAFLRDQVNVRPTATALGTRR